MRRVKGPAISARVATSSLRCWRIRSGKRCHIGYRQGTVESLNKLQMAVHKCACVAWLLPNGQNNTGTCVPKTSPSHVANPFPIESRCNQLPPTSRLQITRPAVRIWALKLITTSDVTSPTSHALKKGVQPPTQRVFNYSRATSTQRTHLFCKSDKQGPAPFLAAPPPAAVPTCGCDNTFLMSCVLVPGSAHRQWLILSEVSATMCTLPEGQSSCPVRAAKLQVLHLPLLIAKTGRARRSQRQKRGASPAIGRNRPFAVVDVTQVKARQCFAVRRQG